MKRVAVGALILAGLAQIVITILEPEFNTAAGLGIGAGFFLFAGLAATGRWWALGVTAIVSGLLTLAAIGQLTDRIAEGETGQTVRVLGFQLLTLTATIGGGVAALRSYGARS